MIRTPHFHYTGHRFHLWSRDAHIPTVQYSKKQNKTKQKNPKEFSKVARYKINIFKSAAFLYTNNEISERESKKKIPFKTASCWHNTENQLYFSNT